MEGTGDLLTLPDGVVFLDQKGHFSVVLGTSSCENLGTGIDPKSNLSSHTNY